jgi:hypothetical protein
MSVTIAARSTQRQPATDSPAADPACARAADKLANPTANLPAFAPVPFATSESCSPAELHAAARAAACPDLFVIHAPEPAAGQRVIADIARFASGRVLVLSPDPAAADRLAERLAATGVVRALSEAENPIRPSPVVAKLTSAALGTGRLEQLSRETSNALAAAEYRLVALDRLAALEAELAEVSIRRDRIEAEVRAQLDNVDIGKKETELASLRRRRKEAGDQPIRKAGFFAWLLGRPKPHGLDSAEINKQVHVLEAEVAALTAARDSAIRAEVSARSAPIVARHGELSAERDHLLGEIGPAGRDAVQAELAAARERAGELAAPEIVRRLLAEPRVVVGTPGSVHADPVFDAIAGEDPPFALLVLDRCEELTEHDFTRLAALATRCVLVGAADPRPHHSPAPSGNGKPHRNGRPPEARFASKLARLLDRETWVHESGRLVCRLMHFTDLSQALSREPLIDRPEIELRFTADAGGEPVVAEVAFPAATTIADAKSFVFHELGEVLLHPCGEMQWVDPLTACWPAAGDGGVWIDLEPGVREQIAGVGLVAFTAAVAFDPAQGWDRAKADAWLEKHLPRESAGRFASVPGCSSPIRGNHPC